MYSYRKVGLNFLKRLLGRFIDFTLVNQGMLEVLNKLLHVVKLK